MAITDILGTALSVGRSLLAPTLAIDVVAILGPGFTPIFAFARPLAAEVRERSKLMEHPLEDGSVIADHIVFQPTEIRLPLIIVGDAEYRSTYALLRSTYKAGTLLTVVTRTGSYPNMVIEEMPHQEVASEFDAIRMRLQLREANFVTPKSGGAVKDAKQGATTSRGQQQTTATDAAKSAQGAGAYKNSGLGPGETGSTLYRWTYGGSATP